jgi:hypothetical protein
MMTYDQSKPTLPFRDFSSTKIAMTEKAGRPFDS